MAVLEAVETQNREALVNDLAQSVAIVNNLAFLVSARQIEYRDFGLLTTERSVEEGQIGPKVDQVIHGLMVFNVPYASLMRCLHQPITSNYLQEALRMVSDCVERLLRFQPLAHLLAVYHVIVALFCRCLSRYDPELQFSGDLFAGDWRLQPLLLTQTLCTFVQRRFGFAAHLSQTVTVPDFPREVCRPLLSTSLSGQSTGLSGLDGLPYRPGEYAAQIQAQLRSSSAVSRVGHGASVHFAHDDVVRGYERAPSASSSALSLSRLGPTGDAAAVQKRRFGFDAGFDSVTDPLVGVGGSTASGTASGNVSGERTVLTPSKFLSQENDELRERLRDAQDRVEKLRQQLDEKTHAHETLVTRCQDMERELETVKQRTRDVEEQLTTLQTRLDDNDRLLSAKGVEITNLTVKLAEQASALVEKDDALRSLQTRLVETTALQDAETAALVAEATQLRAEQTALIERSCRDGRLLAEASNAREHLETETRQLREDLERALANGTATERELTDRVSQAETARDEAVALRKSVQTQLLALQDEYTRLISENTSLQAKLIGLEKELLDKRSDTNEVQGEQARKLMDLAAENAALRRQVQQSEAVTQRLYDEGSAMSARLQQQQATIADLETRLTRVRARTPPAPRPPGL